jgi:hypothetical protein
MACIPTPLYNNTSLFITTYDLLLQLLRKVSNKRDTSNIKLQLQTELKRAEVFLRFRNLNDINFYNKIKAEAEKYMNL